MRLTELWKRIERSKQTKDKGPKRNELGSKKSGSGKIELLEVQKDERMRFQEEWLTPKRNDWGSRMNKTGSTFGTRGSKGRMKGVRRGVNGVQ